MNTCKICQNQTLPVIDFGRMPLGNGFLTQEQFNKEYFFTLAVELCQNCKMFQLCNFPEPSTMFHDSYAFFSSTSNKMAQYYKDKAEALIQNYITNANDSFVVELGSNDGIMLKHFANNGVKHLGIEPSGNVAAIAKKNGVNSIVKFFSKELAEEIVPEYGKADIISASNVMCHIPDLNSVAMGAKLLLKENGVFLFEDPYLGDVIQKTSYDQVYDEHVYVFSVQSVANTFGPHGFDVFHVEPKTNHGGSMCYYLCHSGERPIQPSVAKQLDIEEKLGLNNYNAYKHFALNCEKNKRDLVALLQQLKQNGKKVVGYAATSKSTTILNYCGINPELIECIYDTTPIKQGKFSPGMHIPIKPYDNFKADAPDYAVLFAWNHMEEILAKEQEFSQKGGKWIVFVPEVQTLSFDSKVSKTNY